MNNLKKLVSVELEDLAFLILCAGRYCEGRKSIAPSVLQSIVRKHWSALLSNHRDILVRDLMKYIKGIQKWYPDIRDDYPCEERSRFIAELAAIARGVEEDNVIFTNDSLGINVILGMLLHKDLITPSQCEAAATFIKDKLHSEKMWIGDNDYEAEKFISLYWDELATALNIW